jgi:hypothetical protein
MKTILKVLALIFSNMLFISCGPVLYSNVGQNVPLLQEKGEFSGQISLSESFGGWDASGVGLQGGYAISEKVAAIGSFYSMKGDDINDDNEWRGNGAYFELGAGFFGGNPEKKFIYEAYAGVGAGSIKNVNLTNPGDFINVKYLKPFIQPTVAFSTKYFDLALTPRIAYLTYTTQDDYNFDVDLEQLNPQEFFDKNSNTLVFEPGIMIRGGFPGAKLELQYNYSTLNGPSENFPVINSSFLSIGLRFLISERTYSKK